MRRLRLWRWQIPLLLLSAAALTLSFAPYSIYPLAWIALVPWLLVVGSARSMRAAVLLGGLGGIAFWWLNAIPIFSASFAGATALACIQTMSWMLAAAMISAARLMPVNDEPKHAAGPGKWLIRVLGIACVWVFCEWLRGRVIVKLPLLYIGHSQQPFSSLCQVADLGGAYAVSWLIMLINAAVASGIVDAIRSDDRTIHTRSPLPQILVGLLVVVCCAYGGWHLDDTAPLRDGPVVVAVQTDVRYARGDFASRDQAGHLKLLHDVTSAELEKRAAAGEPPADLVVWPEAVTSPLNPEAREALSRSESGPLLARVHEALSSLAKKYSTTLLVSGSYVGDWRSVNGIHTGTDIHNSVFAYAPDGSQAERYGKFYLVPFGEYLPGDQNWPRLARLFRFFSLRTFSYAVTPGRKKPKPMTLGAGETLTRFLTPICFEDLLAEQLSRTDVDFFATVGDGGWFGDTILSQWTQASAFRCIENRTPMVRSINGNGTCLIDSCGRISELLPARTNGFSSGQLRLDSRRTIYQRCGDWLPLTCGVVSLVLSGRSFRRWIRRRRNAHASGGASASSKRRARPGRR